METLFIGQNLVQLDAVPSTNTYATNLLKDVKVAEGTVINAHAQTEGKGQRGNSWYAEPSLNLTFSVILYPVFLSAENHFYLSKITALALHDSLSELLPAGQHDIKIKWPNDILVNEQKIAGILIENSFRQGQLQHTVIGVGLNVNQQEFPKVARMATSLAALLHKGFDRKEVLDLLCRKLEVRYLQLKNKSTEKLNSDYHSRLYLLNTAHNFTIKGKQGSAVVKGVNISGELELQLENGELSYFEVKEVVF